jgi:hypothetical protein
LVVTVTRCGLAPQFSSAGPPYLSPGGATLGAPA